MVDPDGFCARHGLRILKEDRTATVGVTSFDGRSVVVKRYNTKGPGHAIKRAFRVSRAEHCYRNASRLVELGMLTPAPIAAVEFKFGPVKRRSWYLSEYLPGVLLSDWFGNRSTIDEEDAPIIDQVISVFSQMKAAAIAHGDTKATNWLVYGGRLYLLDLDSMRQYREGERHIERLRRDRRRFLRNFDPDSEFHGVFEQRLEALLSN